MRPLPSLPLLLLVLLAGSPARATAQPALPTNAEQYAELAARCLTGVPDTTAALRLVLPERMPYLAPPLIDQWQTDGRTVFSGDSTRTPAVPRLVVSVDEAAIRYRRSGRGRVERTAMLALRYTFTTPAGAVLAADSCRDSLKDDVPRDALADLELTAFPETQGPPPPPGWPRRYLEPAVLTAATAVVAFLFFSLRSDRADDGL